MKDRKASHGFVVSHGEPHPDDYYATPISLIDAIVARCVDDNILKPTTRIVDAGTGDFGGFGWVLRRHLPHAALLGCDLRGVPEWDFYEEITTNQDWFQYQPSCDVVIGNPPFTLAQEFIEHGLSLLPAGGHLIFLLRLGFLESKKRTPFHQQYPPQHIFVLPKRPCFYLYESENTKRSTDLTAYGVYVWRKGGNNTNLTTLSWLSWDIDEPLENAFHQEVVRWVRYTEKETTDGN